VPDVTADAPDRDPALAPFVERPDDAAVLLDFDGTLSPIVTDPAAARPVDGTAEVLVALAARVRLVAVLSGRPTDFLRTVLPSEVVLSGLYGLEVVRDGRRVDHPDAGRWRHVVDEVARASAARGPDGMVVEPKGLSLTLHYRSRPELAGVTTEWAEQQAAASGLEARPAKMSVELHPPLPADKGTALEALADGLGAVCFAGDDRGDLPAYDALDRLAARGVHTLRLAVAGAESPPDLVARADVVLDDPHAMLAYLRRLADAVADLRT
jgi:trehalose 6-phosphate phosphatase